MKFTQRPGMLLLSLWLIATGLLPLLNVDFQGRGLLLQLLALAAGVLLLIGR